MNMRFDLNSTCHYSNSQNVSFHARADSSTPQLQGYAPGLRITIELDRFIWDADLVERDQWGLYGISQMEQKPTPFCITPCGFVGPFLYRHHRSPLLINSSTSRLHPEKCAYFQLLQLIWHFQNNFKSGLHESSTRISDEEEVVQELNSAIAIL